MADSSRAARISFSVDRLAVALIGEHMAVGAQRLLGVGAELLGDVIPRRTVAAAARRSCACTTSPTGGASGKRQASPSAR